MALSSNEQIETPRQANLMISEIETTTDAIIWTKAMMRAIRNGVDFFKTDDFDEVEAIINKFDYHCSKNKIATKFNEDVEPEMDERDNHLLELIDTTTDYEVEKIDEVEKINETSFYVFGKNETKHFMFLFITVENETQIQSVTELTADEYKKFIR